MYIEKTKKLVSEELDATVGERDSMAIVKGEDSFDITVPVGKTKVKIIKTLPDGRELVETHDVVGTAIDQSVEGMNEVLVGNAFADDYSECYSGYSYTVPPAVECDLKVYGFEHGEITYDEWGYDENGQWGKTEKTILGKKVYSTSSPEVFFENAYLEFDTVLLLIMDGDIVFRAERKQATATITDIDFVGDNAIAIYDEYFPDSKTCKIFDVDIVAKFSVNGMGTKSQEISQSYEDDYLKIYTDYQGINFVLKANGYNDTVRDNKDTFFVYNPELEEIHGLILGNYVYDYENNNDNGSGYERAVHVSVEYQDSGREFGLYPYPVKNGYVEEDLSFDYYQKDWDAETYSEPVSIAQYRDYYHDAVIKDYKMWHMYYADYTHSHVYGAQTDEKTIVPLEGHRQFFGTDIFPDADDEYNYYFRFLGYKASKTGVYPKIYNWGQAITYNFFIGNGNWGDATLNTYDKNIFYQYNNKKLIDFLNACEETAVSIESFKPLHYYNGLQITVGDVPYSDTVRYVVDEDIWGGYDYFYLTTSTDYFSVWVQDDYKFLNIKSRSDAFKSSIDADELIDICDQLGIKDFANGYYYKYSSYSRYLLFKSTSERRVDPRDSIEVYKIIKANRAVSTIEYTESPLSLVFKTDGTVTLSMGSSWSGSLDELGAYSAGFGTLLANYITPKKFNYENYIVDSHVEDRAFMFSYSTINVSIAEYIINYLNKFHTITFDEDTLPITARKPTSGDINLIEFYKYHGGAFVYDKVKIMPQYYSYDYELLFTNWFNVDGTTLGLNETIYKIEGCPISMPYRLEDVLQNQIVVVANEMVASIVGTHSVPTNREGVTATFTIPASKAPEIHRVIVMQLLYGETPSYSASYEYATKWNIYEWDYEEEEWDKTGTDKDNHSGSITVTHSDGETQTNNGSIVIANNNSTKRFVALIDEEETISDFVMPAVESSDFVTISVNDVGSVRTIVFSSPIGISRISISGESIHTSIQKDAEGSLRKFEIGNATATWENNTITVYNFFVGMSLKIGDASFII